MSKRTRRSIAALAVAAAFVLGSSWPDERLGTLVSAQEPDRAPGPIIEDPPGPYTGRTYVRAGADLAHPAVALSTFVVTYNGFTPQAQAAFQAAVDIWASQIQSSVPIRITANWTALPQGVLGSSGPTYILRNFPGAPSLNTWFAVAVANKLSGTDLEPGADDIVANFSSAFDWYLGTDGNAGTKFDFMSVVLHELGHGLGFLGSMNGTGGNGSWGASGFPYVYDQFAINGSSQSLINTSLFPNPSPALGAQLVSNNIFFNGPNARNSNGGISPKLYAPGTWAPGSSYSHLDEATYPAGSPNSLMTYALGPGEAIHDPGPIVRGMLADTGWTVMGACTYLLSATSRGTSARSTTNSVTVTAGAGCGWTATSNVSWIVVTSGSSGVGTQTAGYAVAANAGAARTGTLTIAGQTLAVTQAAHETSPGDFDGDGKADVVVFRPSTGIWYVRQSGAGSGAYLQWGFTGDVPVVGDYDGDGKTDVAVFRPSNGMWYVRNSANATAAFYQWGLTGDVPVPQDYDGDGKTDIAVFRPSTGIWYVLQSGAGTAAFLQWGLPGDVPVAGDYNGDGRVDIAVFRPSSGGWYIRDALTQTQALYQWGATGDIPVPGDYDGDGTTDIAVFRPSTGIWYIQNPATGATSFYQWGVSGDIPVPGDYDGDGKVDVAVFRPSTGIWYIRYSTTGAGAFFQWGLTTDIPIF